MEKFNMQDSHDPFSDFARFRDKIVYCFEDALEEEEISCEHALELGQKLMIAILSYEKAGGILLEIAYGRDSRACWESKERVIELERAYEEANQGHNTGMKTFIATTAAKFVDGPQGLSAKLLEVATKIPEESKPYIA